MSCAKDKYVIHGCVLEENHKIEKLNELDTYLDSLLLSIDNYATSSLKSEEDFSLQKNLELFSDPQNFMGITIKQYSNNLIIALDNLKKEVVVFKENQNKAIHFDLYSVKKAIFPVKRNIEVEKRFLFK